MGFSRWHRQRAERSHTPSDPDEPREPLSTGERRYNPDQPRYPRGHPLGGQWIDLPGGEDDGFEPAPPSAPGGGEGDDVLSERPPSDLEARIQWGLEMGRAVSLGQVDPEVAVRRGWTPDQGRKAADYRPLPKKLYHVTTAASAVAHEGLKTRQELNLTMGTGLGGGSDTTISLTESLEHAEGIREGIREARMAARGELTREDLVRRAEAEGFLEEFKRQAGASWDRDPPEYMEVGTNELARILDPSIPPGGKIPPGMEPPMAEDLRKHGLEPDPSAERDFEGRKVYIRARRKTTEAQKASHRLVVYAQWSRARQFAGGKKDPIFLGVDANALANMDPDEVALLEIEPTEGAVGYQIPYEREWRVHTGRAVPVVRIRSKGLGRATAQRRFDPNQPRWPRGNPLGGQWVSVLPGIPDNPPSGGPGTAGVTRIPSKPSEAAEAAADAILSWDQVAGRTGAPPRDEIVANYARQLRKRPLSKDKDARAAVQSAVAENDANPVWRQITDRFPDDVVLVTEQGPPRTGASLLDTDSAAHRVGGVSVVPDGTIEALRQEATDYAAGLSGRAPKPGDSAGSAWGLAAILRHEYGHSIDANMPREQRQAILAMVPDPGRDLTYYAGTKDNEVIPELLALITHPQYNESEWPETVQDAGRALMHSLGVQARQEPDLDAPAGASSRPTPMVVGGGHLFGANALGGGTHDDTKNDVTEALWAEIEGYQDLPDNAPIWIFYAGEHDDRQGVVPVSVSPYAIARTSDDVRVARVRKANLQAGDGSALLGASGATGERLRFEATGRVDLERPIAEQLPDAPEPDEDVDERIDPDDDVAVMADFLRGQRAITPYQATALGKQLMARVNRRGEYAAGKRKLKKLQRQAKDLTKRKYDIQDRLPAPGDPNSPGYVDRQRERDEGLAEIDRINAEKQEVYAQLREVSPGLAKLRQQAVLRELKAVRPEFGEGKLDDMTRTVSEPGPFALVQFAGRFVPKEWVDASNATDGELSIGEVGPSYPEGRAYYQHRPVRGGGRLFTGIKGDKEDAKSTALHEFAHRAEATSPELPNGQTKIVHAEQAFHNQRTRGEPKTGLLGRDDERGRKDRYYSEYVGREYPDAAEILSMGLEGLFFNKGSAWDEDPEHLQFVLGLLAAA